MGYNRIYVRVPIKGEANLTNRLGAHIKADTIDISTGGLGITCLPGSLEDNTYQIEITTSKGDRIQLSATLIRQDKNSSGFKICAIDKKSLKVITHLVEEFQATEEFIRQIDEHDILEQRFVDEDGNELEVTFETDSSKPKDQT